MLPYGRINLYNLWHCNIIQGREGRQLTKQHLNVSNNYIVKLESLVTLVKHCQIILIYLLGDQNKGLLLFDETLEYGKE